MSTARLEHLNITVSDPQRTAEMLCGLFDWHIRWQGAAKGGGHSVHVGSHGDYVAVYSLGETQNSAPDSYGMTGGLNHVGIVVDDLDTVERRVRLAGFAPHSHADYEPGRRFYFDDHDGIEWEVVSYGNGS